MTEEPRRVRTVLLAVLAASVLLGGCESAAPTPPDADAVAWSDYEDAEAGFSFRYPDVYVVERHGGGVLFRHDGYPVLSISHITAEEADDRGLWADHEPVGEAELAGRSAQRYVYHHQDVFTTMRTVSYVVDHRGKYLGVEFRTGLEGHDEVQRRMLDSFVLR